MDDLLNEIEAFCAKHQIKESRFGRDAVSDTAFIPQLRLGREPRRATALRVRRFMIEFNATAGDAEGPSPPFPNPTRGTVQRHPVEAQPS